jgi:hypothetical protein
MTREFSIVGQFGFVLYQGMALAMPQVAINKQALAPEGQAVSN